MNLVVEFLRKFFWFTEDYYHIHTKCVREVIHYPLKVPVTRCWWDFFWVPLLDKTFLNTHTKTNYHTLYLVEHSSGFSEIFLILSNLSFPIPVMFNFSSETRELTDIHSSSNSFNELTFVFDKDTLPFVWSPVSVLYCLTKGPSIMNRNQFLDRSTRDEQRFNTPS